MKSDIICSADSKRILISQFQLYFMWIIYQYFKNVKVFKNGRVLKIILLLFLWSSKCAKTFLFFFSFEDFKYFDKFLLCENKS
jgi:hypothetical protein